MWHNIWLAWKRYKAYKSEGASRVWLGFGRLISYICSRNEVLEKKLKRNRDLQVRDDHELVKENKLRFYKNDMTVYRTNYGHACYEKAWKEDEKNEEPNLEPFPDYKSDIGKYTNSPANAIEEGADTFDTDWSLERILIESAVVQDDSTVEYLKNNSAKNAILHSSSSSEDSAQESDQDENPISSKFKSPSKKVALKESEAEVTSTGLELEAVDPSVAARLEKKKGKLPMTEEVKKKKSTTTSLPSDDIFMGQAKRAAQAQAVKDTLKKNVELSKSLTTKKIKPIEWVVSTEVSKDTQVVEKASVKGSSKKKSVKRSREDESQVQGEKAQVSSGTEMVRAHVEGEPLALMAETGDDTPVTKKRRSAKTFWNFSNSYFYSREVCKYLC